MLMFQKRDRETVAETSCFKNAVFQYGNKKVPLKRPANNISI